jgi:hypothetical protein
MTTPEHGGPGSPDDQPAPEQEPTPYRTAARFAGERPAGEAYFAVQQVLYEAPQPTDLSVYRLQLNRLWHVAALGLVPPAPVLQAIEAILATGEPADLPPVVWDALAQRRAQSITQASWVERHHRPGERLS